MLDSVMINEIMKATWETIYMVLISTFFAVVIGFIPSIILVVTDENGLRPNKYIYRVLDIIINILRSFPFIILMIAIFPLTRMLTGTTIGTKAAMVPLTIAAAPFAARVIESALKEVEPGIIEAARSFGAGTFQIIFRVMIKEALPSILLGITLTIISVVGYSAMAGVIGGGGLGSVALNYGYYRFQTDIMIYTVILLIIIVQVFQSLGNLLYKKLNK